MTHTLHRRGDRESLDCDYVILTMSAKGMNEEGSREKIKKILKILLNHNPVNFGDMVTGNSFVKSRQEILDNIQSTSIVHAVFTQPGAVSDALKELKEAEIGLSVVVTGIHESTHVCCERAGLRKHTVEHSLGIFGNVKTLPSDEVLELTTMCGHGMVSASLVSKTVSDIKKGRKTLKSGAIELTRPCHCGIYNPFRAEILLRRLLALTVLDSND